jgi:crotonobetainyl-CoA:carnitine CoA-transferase CaiB-like acyl-CoA transferase
VVTPWGGRAPVVLAAEQALSMSYATLRLAQLGLRVIRVEPTPAAGSRGGAGDPNRHIGPPVADGARRGYFVAPNCAKEALALNLKDPRGREVLRSLVRALPVDVFCTNTLPARHAELGIDAASLRRERPDLVWACISALGLGRPEVPGYDPVLQALCGYMDLTGDPDGPPTQCGPPIIDLKAGDEAFAQVILALWERDRTGSGKTIDVSMAQVAASWLLTSLPMLELGSAPGDLRRAGNRHRQFIPTDAYPTADGFVYLAIGSDAQWRRLVREPLFASLDQRDLDRNEGRRARGADLYAALGALTSGRSTQEVSAALARAQVPHAPITPIERVLELPFVAEAALRTRTPDGRVLRLPPPAVSTPRRQERAGELPFAPAYGEHTDALLREAGLCAEDIAALHREGVVA